MHRSIFLTVFALFTVSGLLVPAHGDSVVPTTPSPSEASSPRPVPPLPGTFDLTTGKLTQPNVDRLLRLRLDTVMAYYMPAKKLGVGLGIGVENRGRVHPSLQLADQKVGLGLGYDLFKQYPIGIGVSVVRDFDQRRWLIGVYGAIIKW